MKKLIANERNYSLLRRFAQRDKLPHALLIEGAPGSGKDVFAKFAAACALCEAEKEPPCESCRICDKVERDIHPDVLRFSVPEGKRDFPVAHMRTIGETLQIAPSEGKRKIYILEQAHTMNANSQNAMLKMIEEPPPFVMFILLAENAGAMLETVLSRVRTVRLNIPSVEDCCKLLGEKFPEQEPSLLLSAAQGADGNVGRAIQLLSEAKPSRAAADSKKLMNALFRLNRYEMLCILSGYDQERQALVETLQFLSRRIGMAALGQDLPKDAPIFVFFRLDNAARIVSDTAQAVHRNGQISLLCAHMTESAVGALGG